jgi:hypothetical protein
MSNPRPCELNLVFGDKNQGKSSYIVQTVKQIFEARPTKILSIIKSDSIAYSGFRRLNSYNELNAFCSGGVGFAKFFDNNGGHQAKKEMMRFLGNNFRNGILIIEDATAFMRGHIPDDFIDWIVNHKNYGVDVFLVYHFLKNVPFSFKMLYNNLVLFKVPDNIEHNQSEYKEYKNLSQILEAHVKVNAMPERAGYIQHYAEIVNNQIYYN